jgi:hypothetical protein
MRSSKGSVNTVNTAEENPLFGFSIIIKRHGNQITIEVKNPVEWLMEVNAHGGKDTE